MIIRRLKYPERDTDPYEIETRAIEHRDNAEFVVKRWWQSRKTVAAAIILPPLEGTTASIVDSLYVRETIDEARIPEKWNEYWKPPPKVPKESASTLTPRLEPVTLFDEDEVPKPPPSREQDTIDQCGCCLAKREKHEEGRDRSPSGRLADARCPACGRPWTTRSSKSIWESYSSFLKRK